MTQPPAMTLVELLERLDDRVNHVPGCGWAVIGKLECGCDQPALASAVAFHRERLRTANDRGLGVVGQHVPKYTPVEEAAVSSPFAPEMPIRYVHIAPMDRDVTGAQLARILRRCFDLHVPGQPLTGADCEVIVRSVLAPSSTVTSGSTER